MDDPRHLYDCLLDYSSSTDVISRLSIGLVWTVCQSDSHNTMVSGLAMSPGIPTRTIDWSGTLVSQPLKQVGNWITDWDPYKATVAMAALNCSYHLNRHIPDATLLECVPGKANLTVFEYFLPQLLDKKVVIIGRYPGIETYVEKYGWQVLERMPQAGDYPDPASEYLIPDADWVFISATTIINKTFPRLAELSESATTVLMGPTVPWLPEMHRFGVDYLVGVETVDPEALYQTACEGGGVRIFETGVRYKVLDLKLESNLSWLKESIGLTYQQKAVLTEQMESWYADGNLKRFPDYKTLNDVNLRLSRMDSAYKTLWDQQQAQGHGG